MMVSHPRRNQVQKLEHFDACREACLAILGEREFQNAWQQGQALNLEKAVALALEATG